MVKRARAIGFFENCFDSSTSAEAVLAYLKGQDHAELTGEGRMPPSRGQKPCAPN